ncbi:MAG: hypothetical protein K5873_04155 [Treponema sp.]|nr:hypothetical protein [Treponema sp.]
MKKIFISSDDYECYRMLLPWKYLFSSLKKNFILRELEKVHPCFSGNCCYDTKYSVRKKKLMADVVVMEKENLAEYRQKGGLLYLQSEKKRSVFSSRAKIRRFLSIFMILMAGIFSFRIARSCFYPGEEVIVQGEKRELNDKVISQNENPNLENPDIFIPEVFLSVSRRGGKISSFSYSSKGEMGTSLNRGLTTFSIYGCNCEEVANARYSVVSFKNNRPYFELMLPFSIKDFEEPVPSESTVEEKENLLPDLRKELASYGALIESQKNSSDSVELDFLAPFSSLYSCLQSCIEIQRASNWRENYIYLSEKGKYCKVRLKYSKNQGKTAFSALANCAKYSWLFSGEESSVKKSGGGKKGALLPVKTDSNEKKIGQIKKKDGSVFVCFRNQKGKIAYEKRSY